MKHFVKTDLGFDALNPNGVVWKKFIKKWTECSDIFDDNDSDMSESNSSYDSTSEVGAPDNSATYPT